MLNERGEWLDIQPATWDVRFDRRVGELSVRFAKTNEVLDLKNLLAIWFGDERQVTDVKRTIGRMALTGIGASLFSKGEAGGLGAGLLDLSLRGKEQKLIVSGTLIFRNSAAISFSLPRVEFDQFAKFVPPHAFEEGAAEQAVTSFGLLERMRADGRRVLAELAGDYDSAHARVQLLKADSEAGATFSLRDEARQAAAAAQVEVDNLKFLLVGLLFDHGIPPRQFLAQEKSRGSLEAMFALKEAAPAEAHAAADVAPQGGGLSGPPMDVENLKTHISRKVWIILIVVIVLLLIFVFS
ncbi:hypothetical protein [Beijerinckia sp. L45]|uniref:hypothetical protein n=1 Tax=Beijerinckia sp. L45 TaxID=1641855 RepID=UPI00131E72F9|nr:hypothetical protein [Beijerinckia sp. L45]